MSEYPRPVSDEAWFNTRMRELRQQVEEVGRRRSPRPMRLAFATKPALDAFEGWPGLEGFVESENRNYVWTGAAWQAVETDWVNLGGYLLSGFSGSVRGRIVGSVVELASNSITGSVPSAVGSIDIMSDLPPMLRPSTSNRFGSVYGHGYAGVVGVRPAGTVLLANRSGESWSTFLFSITYLIG